ncbi:MAG: BolA family protein [Pseudomonadota bacterium]
MTANSKNKHRLAEIRQRLQTAFAPGLLIVEDDSHKHIGHAGAKSGKGHFTVTIHAEAFQDCALRTSHQKIYQALDDLMENDIHALSIKIEK